MHPCMSYIEPPTQLPTPSPSPTLSPATSNMSGRESPPPLPTNAEDLKRHKALSAMESTSTVSSTDDAPSNSSATTDPSALGAALGSITSAPAPAPTSKPAVAIKVKAEDVAFIMEHLELPKPRATDLLRKNGGELIKTLRAFVTAA